MKVFYPSLLFIAFSLAGPLAAQESSVQELISSGKQKFKSAEYSSAETDFNGAIQEVGPRVEAYTKWTSEYATMNNFQRASLETTIPELKKEWAVLYYYRGLCQTVLGKKDQAIKDFELALLIDSAYAESYYEIGLIRCLEGKKEEGCINLKKAVNLGYEKAIEKFENNFCWSNSISFYRNGVAKLQLKEYEDAVKEFSMCILLNPDSGNAYSKRGLAYSGLGKHDLAITEHSKAIGINSKNPEYYVNRGISYNASGKFQEAFDDLSIALTFNPRYYEAFLYRAAACEGMKNQPSALYDYTKASGLKPAEASLYFKMGMLKRDLKDKKGACADFKKATDMGYEEAESFAENCK